MASPVTPFLARNIKTARSQVRNKTLIDLFCSFIRKSQTYLVNLRGFWTNKRQRNGYCGLARRRSFQLDYLLPNLDFGNIIARDIDHEILCCVVRHPQPGRVGGRHWPNGNHPTCGRTAHLRLGERRNFCAFSRTVSPGAAFRVRSHIGRSNFLAGDRISGGGGFNGVFNIRR